MVGIPQKHVSDGWLSFARYGLSTPLGWETITVQEPLDQGLKCLWWGHSVNRYRPLIPLLAGFFASMDLPCTASVVGKLADIVPEPFPTAMLQNTNGPYISLSTQTLWNCGGGYDISVWGLVAVV